VVLVFVLQLWFCISLTRTSLDKLSLSLSAECAYTLKSY
jgi:hypothetical protein